MGSESTLHWGKDIVEELTIFPVKEGVVFRYYFTNFNLNGTFLGGWGLKL